jgi:UDP-N-acetylmuramoyl-L-alanyl-D-glutamate--2,6-diaminopimelate ligase
MSMSLHDLLAALPKAGAEDVPNVAIRGITADSRQVESDWLFVAIRGAQTDGHRYVQDALQRGAAAVVVQEDVPGAAVPVVRVPDTRVALALLASAWHGHPGRSLVVIGVTGTDGKTTTASLIYNMLVQAGLRAGLVSTVSAQIGSSSVDTGFHVTTPDPMALQSYLAQMVEAGLTHVVLEATSHGLAQHRVDGSEFDVAVVTNITHEHLDFHGSLEAYRQAKGRLLELTALAQAKPDGPAKAAVINADDPGASGLPTVDGLDYWRFGRSSSADIQARSIRATTEGVSFEIVEPDSVRRARLALIGDYNVSNALAAYTCCVGPLGIDPDAALRGLGALDSVPGRMELIDMGQPFQAVVDFAHTPNALRQALTAARGLTDRRVIAVFGSAGLRDRQKRRLMAKVSAELADITILTAEDPRTESLSAILSEMAQAAREAGAVEGVNLWQVPDRGLAILTALRLAKHGDLVIACGKGHEQSMCFGETEYAWDDRQAMRAALAELLGRDGFSMPVLPTQPGR